MAPARLLLCLVAIPSVAFSREWTDVSGRYSLEADLVAFDDDEVVLQRKSDGELGSVPIDSLSDEDRSFVASKEATPLTEQTQVWTTRAGLRVPGRVVDYARREVSIQRRRGKIYVNNRVFENLPPIYRKLVPQVVAHFEQNNVSDENSLKAWLVHQKGAPQTYTVDGVIFELENGDEYAVPFFVFSDKDLAVLERGWEEWLAASGDYQSQADTSLDLQSMAAAYHQDAADRRRIAQLQLGMQAVEAGVTSLWEVTLYPGPGVGGPPLWVVAPGRDSRTAQQNALANNPGYAVGPVRRVSRRR